MQPANGSPNLKFGPYLLDMRAGELRKNGSRIRLQEKPLRVLAALAEQQGEVVTRDELRKRLWPDDTFVDFETGLNTAVSKLRDALSDTAEKPRFIETIPRRGYRFLSAVETVNGHAAATLAPVPAAHEPPSSANVSAASPSATTDAPAQAARRAHSISKIWLRAAAVAGMGVIAFTFWWFTPLPEPRILSVYPVTTTGKQDFLVRPATDGVRIFYVERDGDHYDLMQVSVNGGEPQRIAAPFPNTLIWDVSPDGSQYLMTSFVHRGDPSPLWSWPVTGGPPIELGDFVSGSAAWSPDGKMLAGHSGHELFLANADGVGKRTLAKFHEEPDSPVWSPDGETIRFTLNDPDRDTGTIWEIRKDGSGLRSVLPDWKSSPRLCCGTWTPDGRYFVFVDAVQRSRLWALREKGAWWRRSPRGPFLLAAEAGGSWGPFFGRDGKHLFFYGETIEHTIERVKMASGESSVFLPEAHLPAMPSFSRDGQWVAYVQFDTGAVWRSRLDGRDRSQLTPPAFHGSFPQWSPDGRMLVLAARRPGEPPNAYLMSADGGRPDPLVPGTQRLVDPDWSADGSSIIVARLLPPRAPGNDEDSVLAIVDVKTRSIHTVEGSEHLSGPRWSPDGRWIAALNIATHDLMIGDVTTKQWRTLAHGGYISLPSWSADGAYVYYQDLLAAGEPIFRVNVVSNQIEKMAGFQQALSASVHRCAFLGLAPDGTALVAFERGNADIYGATVSLP